MVSVFVLCPASVFVLCLASVFVSCLVWRMCLCPKVSYLAVSNSMLNGCIERCVGYEVLLSRVVLVS